MTMVDFRVHEALGKSFHRGFVTVTTDLWQVFRTIHHQLYHVKPQATIHPTLRCFKIFLRINHLAMTQDGDLLWMLHVWVAEIGICFMLPDLSICDVYHCISMLSMCKGDQKMDGSLSPLIYQS